MCGDEPHRDVVRAIEEAAFPTCVGMNRPPIGGLSRRLRVPYMCGDEPPADFAKADLHVRSLHVWG